MMELVTYDRLNYLSEQDVAELLRANLIRVYSNLSTLGILVFQIDGQVYELQTNGEVALYDEKIDKGREVRLVDLQKELKLADYLRLVKGIKKYQLGESAS